MAGDRQVEVHAVARMDHERDVSVPIPVVVDLRPLECVLGWHVCSFCSAAGGVALHPARVRARAQHPVGAPRDTALRRPSDQARRPPTSWPRPASPAPPLAEPRLELHASAGRPPADRTSWEVVRVEHRRVDRRLQVQRRRRRGRGRTRATTGPAGRRPACRTRVRPPSRSASDGDSVVRGRLPGASDAGSPSSSQNICARVPRQKPSPGIAGELCSQPPLGVAETRLPKRSATSRWHVSPRVGSPTPGAAVAAGRTRRQPRPSGRRAAARRDASAPISARARPRSAASSRRLERHAANRVAVPRLAVGERELRALDHRVDVLARSMPEPAGRARRAARAAAGTPAPGPTARS